MDLSTQPEPRDLILICIQPKKNSKHRKVVEKEARRMSKKMSKSHKMNLFQDGEWEGQRVINFAVLGGHQLLLNTLVKFLHVDPKIPEPVTNRTPLHLAAEAGQNAMIETLLSEDYNCPIDALDVCGSAPLNFAIFNGKGSTMDLLLDRGASTETRNFFGLPIHYAAYKGYIHAVKRLHGINAASASVVVFGFCTPIAAAVSTGSFGCTEYLAEFTTVTASPLMYRAVACILLEENALPIIDVLLRNGVDANLIDEEFFEEVPIILAAKRGWKQAVEVLLEVTDPIAGVDWSVDSLMAHVSTEAFRDMDLVKRETKLDHLKRRILQELEDRQYLSAELICLSLRHDMGDETFYSWMCLCQFIIKLAEVSSHVGCNKDDILSVGEYCYQTGQLDMAEVASKAALVLAPEDNHCISLYEQVREAQEAATKEAQEAVSSSGRL